MAGSRAASAREPGQIREEAALSDTARAPRISLAGAEDRRARPGASFKGGCTVRFEPMSEQENLAIARLAMERPRWHPAEDGAMALGLTRGRASRLDGRWGFNIVLALRDGKIVLHEWFTDREGAVAAASDA
jgi:hypothetical protein